MLLRSLTTRQSLQASHWINWQFNLTLFAISYWSPSTLKLFVGMERKIWFTIMKLEKLLQISPNNEADLASSVNDVESNFHCKGNQQLRKLPCWYKDTFSLEPRPQLPAVCYKWNLPNTFRTTGKSFWFSFVILYFSLLFGIALKKRV